MPKIPLATPEDYVNTFTQSPQGISILEDLKKAHYFYDSSFDPNPYEAARKEGERNVVLRILTIIDQYERSKDQ